MGVLDQQLKKNASLWRAVSAGIVEELFPVVAKEGWDLLLDLRQALLHGTDWEKTLSLFLEGRKRWEADHYLPFWRLRNLLAQSLRLSANGSLEVSEEVMRRLLQERHSSLQNWKSAAEAELSRILQPDGLPLQMELREAL